MSRLASPASSATALADPVCTDPPRRPRRTSRGLGALRARHATIPEHAHSHGEYVAAFAAAGLRVRRLLEPGLTRAQARARAKADHEEAFEEALRELPAVIVWEVERR